MQSVCHALELLGSVPMEERAVVLKTSDVNFGLDIRAIHQITCSLLTSVLLEETDDETAREYLRVSYIRDVVGVSCKTECPWIQSSLCASMSNLELGSGAATTSPSDEVIEMESDELSDEQKGQDVGIKQVLSTKPTVNRGTTNSVWCDEDDNQTGEDAKFSEPNAILELFALQDKHPCVSFGYILTVGLAMSSMRRDDDYEKVMQDKEPIIGAVLSGNKLLSSSATDHYPVAERINVQIYERSLAKATANTTKNKSTTAATRDCQIKWRESHMTTKEQKAVYNRFCDRTTCEYIYKSVPQWYRGRLTNDFNEYMKKCMKDQLKGVTCDDERLRHTPLTQLMAMVNMLETTGEKSLDGVCCSDSLHYRGRHTIEKHCKKAMIMALPLLKSSQYSHRMQSLGGQLKDGTDEDSAPKEIFDMNQPGCPPEVFSMTSEGLAFFAAYLSNTSSKDK